MWPPKQLCDGHQVVIGVFSKLLWSGPLVGGPVPRFGSAAEMSKISALNCCCHASVREYVALENVLAMENHKAAEWPAAPTAAASCLGLASIKNQFALNCTACAQSTAG